MKPATLSSDAFWNLSSAYRDAADFAYALTRAENYTGLIVVPCVFLYFRCIELSLKSVLIYESVPEHEITRTLGHRISALLQRAVHFPRFAALGLFTKDDRDIIDRFSQAYADKWFEYPEDPPAAYPPLEKLKDLAHRVSHGIQTYERQKA
jgi:hypothetical protein